jgi:hypothetical protein
MTDMKITIPSVPLSLPILALFISLGAAAQQNIISDVDNTHPEIDRLFTHKAIITGFAVREGNNSNEIYWTAAQDEEVRKYIVEYSANGIDFQSAGEVLANSARSYSVTHTFNYEHPMLYRLRTEQLNGKYFYTTAVPSEGYGGTRVVQLYPTIISGNTVNLIAALPIDKINVIAPNGVQVYERAVGGQRDNMTVVLPSLSHGLYYMVFTGRNWKATEKFIVQ